jgi:small subunit ribosomal protein S1
MSKKVLSAQQFCKASPLASDDAVALTPQQEQELAHLYEGALGNYRQGSLTEGKVVAVTSDGVLVDIGFKSDGLIPLYEFSEDDLKKYAVGTSIEVTINDLEDANGVVVLSFEQAKAARVWSTIMKLFEENKPVEGIVTHKVKGGLNVDIGVPAFLPGSQVDVQRVADFDTYLKQPVTAYIIKVNPKRGNVIISRRKYLSEQRADARKRVMDTIHVGDVIQGVVKNITNYGAFVDIGGVDGLLHITDMAWTRIAHPSEMLKIGDTVAVKVLTLDAVHEKISLGIKQLAGNPWEQLSQDISIGSTVKGTISSIADYGLFVTVARGVEGLIHISEVSWTERISDLHKYYRVGDTVEARVVSLDTENRRMSLSVKQLDKNPWDVIAENLKVGQVVSGPVSNVVDFGIFVQVTPGIDGLVHVADFSWTEHVKHPSDLYKKGDVIQAIVTDINPQKKKISLSIKQLQQNPWIPLKSVTL